MTEAAIAEHGLIGDLQTAALVSTDGSVHRPPPAPPSCAPRGALTGAQIGNFPQAFTHLALVDAAITLDQALDGVSSR